MTQKIRAGTDRHQPKAFYSANSSTVEHSRGKIRALLILAAFIGVLWGAGVPR
jgi:hypothetical protein